MSGIGRLSFKGDEPGVKKKKKKKHHTKKEENEEEEHGWIVCDSLDEIGGPTVLITKSVEPVALLSINEKNNQVTCSPMDIQDIQEVQPTMASQVFIVSKLPGSHSFTLKSAMDRFLGSDAFGVLSCTSEAAGPAEEWTIVKRTDGFALQQSELLGSKFLRIGSDGSLRVDSETIGFKEIVLIKGQSQFMHARKTKKTDLQINSALLEVELLKKSISFGNKYIAKLDRDTESLIEAKRKGNLNEELLDRRVKLKKDKFC